MTAGRPPLRFCEVCGTELAPGAPLPAQWLIHATGVDIPGCRFAFTCSPHCRDLSPARERYRQNERDLARLRAARERALDPDPPPAPAPARPELAATRPGTAQPALFLSGGRAR